MAAAKIIIETMANNEGLQKLNTELAEGCQRLKAAQAELRQLEKVTNGGSTATAEQAARMKELNTEILRQKQYNGQLNKAINETTGEIRKQISGMDKATQSSSLWGKAMQTLGFDSKTLSTALGVLGGNVLTSVVSSLKEFAMETLNIGANTQKFIAALQGMGLSAKDAMTTYRQFNDVARDTSFDADRFYQIGQQMMLLGLNSQQAADMMRICADAAMGMGKGQEGAERLALTLAKIESAGRLGQKQIDDLKMYGIDAVSVIAEKTGESADVIAQALSKGAINGQYAFSILADYMQTEFSGAMVASKQNTLDYWGDFTSNMQAMMAEIGIGIFDAFDQGEIIQQLIGLTQSFLDMLRSDGTGILTDIGNLGKIAFGIIGDALGIICTSIKITILAVKELYDGFRKMCSDVIDWLADLCSPLIEAYNWIKRIVVAIGNDIKTETDKAWSATFNNGAKDTDGITLKGVATTMSTAGNISNIAAAYQTLDKAQKTAIINQEKFNKTTQEGINWEQQITSATNSFAKSVFDGTSSMLDSLQTVFMNFAESVCESLMQIYLRGLLLQSIGLLSGGGSIMAGSTENAAGWLTNGGYILGHANGGIASGWSLVGERGPELVNFSSPGRVYTASETAAALGGGSGTNVTVEIINQSGQQLKGTQGTPRVDNLKGIIVPVVLEAYAENYGGMQNIFGGGRR